jgi:uncharacterized protein (DUF1501 family)
MAPIATVPAASALHPTRRAFLGTTLGGALVTLGHSMVTNPLRALTPAGGPAAASKFLVVVNLRGGNDGLNTVVPVRHLNYAKARPSIRIAPAAALSLDAGPYPNKVYSLHPSLANVAALYATGEAAIVNLVGYPRADLSHAESTEIWSRGLRAVPSSGDSGWIARYKDRYARGSLEVIGLGTGRLLDFAGGETNALVLSAISSFGFAEDPRYPSGSALRNRVVAEILDLQPDSGAKGEIKQALRAAYDQVRRMQTVVSNYRSTVTYPQNGLAGRLREAAMLTQADLDTKVFYVQTGGFDPHSSQGNMTGSHAGLLAGVDSALGAFAQDLKNMGAWNRCVIAVISEFGRRNDENGSRGTDHGSSNPVLLLGGAVRGGVHGREHSEEDLLLEHTPYDVDFRSIYRNILARHFGVDPAPVFTEKQDREHELQVIL